MNDTLKPSELETIASRHGLTDEYPPAAVAEANAWVQEPGIDDPGLTDLTTLPFCTIDNVDSRDLDQALHIARAGDGYRLRYALADASFYTPPTGALFAEALARGASYYLPGRAYPMLPRPLSEGTVSLNPNVVRRALVMDLTLGPDGLCRSTKLVRARIRSRKKHSYSGVQAYYDGTETASGEPGKNDPAYAETLDLLAEVGASLIADARRRNVVRYDRGPRLDVERFNEQISLLCNVQGAQLLAQAENPNVQAVFRVHPAPPPERLDALAALTETLCRVHRLPTDLWRWDPAQPLSDYLDRLPKNRVAAAIQRQALLCNVRSTYGAEPGEHFGIGAGSYARFTAPMREIVGIFTHKEALEIAVAHRLPSKADLALRAQVVTAGNEAKDKQKRIQKDCDRILLDHMLTADARDSVTRIGTVVGISPTRTYVQLDDVSIDVKIYGPPKRTLHPGHAVRLSVSGQDKRGRWRFKLRRV